jgi:hypothetical protein
MINALPFGQSGGFGEGKRANEHYYSSGFRRTPHGITTGYGVSVLKDSVSLSGLGNVKYFADRNGRLYAQDDNGKIYEEATPGAGDFALVRSPSNSNGAGLIGDQKARLLYAANTSLGMYDGTTWTDTWKSGVLTSWQHPMDLYEDLVIIGNKNGVAVLYSDDSLSTAAFDLPASFDVTCLRSGKNGILIGANLGYSGYLILWNPLYDRSAAPWIPVSGKVQSIERSDDGWIVVTQKAILWTNGYSTQQLFSLLDDPLGFAMYTVAPQGTLRVNDKLFILNQNGGYLRLKAGVYVFDLSTYTFEFLPVSTLNTWSVTPLAIFASKTSTQNIVVGYQDAQLAKNYVGSIRVDSGTKATFISEPVASGPGDKTAEAVILSLAPSLEYRGKGAISFNASVKVYDFTRPLWGWHATNALAASAITLRVDGSSNSVFKAQVGDEVTILEGPNAGEVRHIASIASAGTNTETWTMSAAFSNATAAGIDMQVEPWKLVGEKTFTSETDIPELYFNDTEKHRGKRFMVKVLFENITNAQLQLQPSTFVYDDLGPTT